MDYQVPQFIEVEDKIFGPFTLKQFIYLAGGAGIVVMLVLSLPLFIGILLSIPVAAFALALAFYKMNGKTFVEMVEYGVGYYFGKRLYVWKKEKEPVAPEAPVPAAVSVPPKEALTKRKLEALAWSLDIKTDRNQTIT